MSRPFYILYDDLKSLLCFDIVNSITINNEADIAEFALESGEVISDHIIQKNAIITVNATVTDYPHQGNPLNTAGAWSVQDSILNVPGRDVETELQLGVRESPVPIQIPSVQYPKFERKAIGYVQLLNPNNLLQGATQAIGAQNMIQQDGPFHFIEKRPAKYGTQPAREKQTWKRKDPILKPAKGWKPESNILEPGSAEQFSRKFDVYYNLYSIFNLKKMCTIFIDEKSEYNTMNFNNMHISKLELPRNVDDGSAFNFNITFQQVQTLFVSDIDFQSLVPKETKAQKNKNIGAASPGKNTDAAAQSDVAHTKSEELHEIQ